MYITVSIVKTNVPVPHDLITVDVAGDMTLQDLKAIIESETNVKPIHQHLFFNNVPLRDDEATFFSAGINNGDVLAVHVRAPTGLTQSTTTPSSSAAAAGASRQTAAQSTQHPNMQDAETVRLQLLGDPRSLALVRAQNPEVADALHDPVRFTEIFNREKQKRMRAEAEKEARIAALNADPFNVDAQKEIEELIRQEAVHENLQAAMEYTPEAFGRVNMLYIPVEVNKTPIKAFVDSGAQVTVMSPACAERCNIMRLIDRRYGGVAKGVGTAKIMGRVHSAQIKIGSIHLASSFTVMEGKHIDLLIGLDMLKRYQANIDLKDMVLRIGDQAVPFLDEAEIPKEHEEEMWNGEPIVAGKDGAKVGANSGAVRQEAQQPQQPQHSQHSQQSSEGNQSPVIPNSQFGFIRPGAPVTLSPTRFPEASITKIMEFGFSRGEAIAALEAADGNVDGAIGFLI